MRNPIRIVSSIGLLAAALALVGVGLSLDHPVGIEQDLGKGASGSHALDSPKTEAPLDETPLGQMQGMLLQLTTLKDRVRDLESDLARLRDASATTTRRHSFELLVKVAEAAGNTITDLLATAQECNVMVRDPQLTRDYMVRDEMTVCGFI